MNETISTNTKDFFITAFKELQISENKLVLLESIATAIVQTLKQNKTVNLNYISTNNSQRSQISQVWSTYAAHYFKLSNINSFSGGTNVTSFHRKTVKTLQKVGFTFKIIEFSHQNPTYAIGYHNYIKPILVFSKLYNHDLNPSPFFAITNNAFEIIPEAIQQFEMPFNNINNFEHSINKAEEYAALNKQIAGEIHFIFHRVSAAL
ncbi:hypothetical protein ACFQ5N_10590 [Lutibacter holmesii]|uniref:Uncharacterized protein n=1 Tax=Lutibacter holmesii TaxID=1137985 RepID=A0ABW3WPF0_9FLAO